MTNNCSAHDLAIGELDIRDLEAVSGGWQKLFDIKVAGMNVTAGINDNGKAFSLVESGGRFVATVAK